MSWWEILTVANQPGQIRRPGGLIKEKLGENAPVPEWFVSPQKRQAQKQEIADRQAAAQQQRRDYESYLRDQAAQHIEQNTLENEYEVRKAAKIASLRKHLPKSSDQELGKIAHPWVLDQFAEELNLGKTFDEWRADQPQPAAAAS